MNLLTDFISLFYPDVCFLCGKSLYSGEKVLCTKCFIHLPSTKFTSAKDNAVASVFWGRVALSGAIALFSYRKGGSIQKLIHLMKYQGHKEIGIFFGNILGSEIKEMKDFEPVDLILPIPLFKKKLKKRGFNQAALIARGISETLSVDYAVDAVARFLPSTTQTKKSRYNRWENVENIFKIVKEEKLKNRHILLVDDVITTGATMEACLQVLSKVDGISLSAVAVAFSR